MVTLKFYAALREAAGQDEFRLELKRSCPVKTLIRSLRDLPPGLVMLLEQGTTLVSVNEEMARPDTVVNDGDEVAFMPPFSGGAAHRSGRQAVQSLPMARIQEADFSLDAEVSRVKQRSKRIGAVAVFMGSARDFSKGREVLSIHLEQYAGMAEKKIWGLREAALKKFQIIEALIIHRTGELSIGDNIVLIIIGAEHRAQAFEACRWCIDELKRTVPLWKKEKTPDGEIWVEDRP